MTTRFENGVTNTKKHTTLGEFVALDPTQTHVFFDDFDTYAAADWTVTETSTSATQALADGDGGLLLLTNSTTDNDIVQLQKVGESFKFEAGKKLWFKTRFKINEVLQSDMIVGLVITDTSTVAAVSDGVYFMKDDGDANIDFHVEKNSTDTTTTAVAAMVADTFITLGFYYNGKDAIEIYVNDVKKGTSAVTNLPDDEELTATFTLQQGEGTNAKTATIDYLFAAKER
jgi:hypothetical protein